MRTGALTATIVLIGCNLELDLPDPPGCDERTVFYLDADGDGFGDGTDVFIGCAAPGPEWVVQGPPPTTDTAGPDTADTAGPDTSDTAGPDTSDTAGPDTAVPDTVSAQPDTADTAVPDTASPPRDTASPPPDTASPPPDTADTAHG